MGRARKARSLDVWMNGELVGRWTVARGEDAFAYDPRWLTAAHGRPLSLSMPLRPEEAPYRGLVVRAFFENLLPDHLDVRRRLMTKLGAASTSAFDLLEEAGRDCVGAVQLLRPSGRRPEVRKVVGRTVSDAQIADRLAQLRAPGLGGQDPDEFRISLAGAQEKTAFLRWKGRWMAPRGATPTTHIFKLPLGHSDAMAVDLSTSVENEWLCAQLLPEYGIPCANAQMKTFGAQTVLVVERFDRVLSGDRSWIIRRPQEDLCQATGTPPDQKYESQGGPGVLDVMELLHGSAQAAEDRAGFFRTQVLFWLLCAIDGHAKNFSVFIEAGGQFRLTPRYDVLSALPYLGPRQHQLSPHKVKMAMGAVGKNKHYRWSEIQARHWLETGRRCGLPEGGRPLVEALVEQTPNAVEAVRGRLPRRFPAQVAEPILEGLLRAAASAGEQLARARR